MDGIAGGKENISNCPYQLDKLIADQGLRQVFGSKNHRMSNEPSDPEYDATIDMLGWYIPRSKDMPIVID
ncbi:hypothetical protein ISF_07580 [Cordyceps fumosorosea ARSEF 2679]|uniref:Uncharacterized protein n=1 Tax=Cordyceps fumosorosea (strain ARSEF 2679) TaxID=1081104 RepID=A0A167NV84_CORFA|nr:hypothetical protein ISF_07580 [Cordyceps fumosorosea ARSEF 2679]OAA55982.1 hypothetical protein ISF_07580 [Cordyceps fumosorosea ARSEF 2679]